MATVLLAGAYGQRNPGDEALLTSFVQSLSGHELVIGGGTVVCASPVHRSSSRHLVA
jgi:polysaccharide pyruvyl transferase WcaK-like protein